jgi:hypothetical protein
MFVACAINQSGKLFPVKLESIGAWIKKSGPTILQIFF